MELYGSSVSIRGESAGLTDDRLVFQAPVPFGIWSGNEDIYYGRYI